MHTKTLKQISILLREKKISSEELVKLYMDRIEESDLNTFLHIDRNLTLKQARAADCRIAKGEVTALMGVPIAHKDVFVTRGWRTTAGSKMLENYTSPFSSSVVEQFDSAGMVTLGKLNCDEFAMGSSNETSYFGPVKNPWDKTAVPGGSSGGSAAAVAADLVPAATATDTGGSIRQPAAMCGVTGIKPTYGSVSRFGMIAFASSLDQAGVIAKTAEDCALLLNTLVHFDERDSTNLKRENENFEASIYQKLNGLRIGIPFEYFSKGLSYDVESTVHKAIQEYEKLGAEIVNISLPNTELSIPSYYVIATAEASSNMSRFDGIRYGYRAADCKNLGDMYRKTRSEGFGEEVKRRILMGTYVLSEGYYSAYYLKAQKIRRLIAKDFLDVLGQSNRKCDVIMGPVSPTVAWDLGTKIDDPVKNYLGDIYTIPASLAGLPSISIPCGFGQGEKNIKRPVGLQIIGNYYEEARLLNVAHQYQKITSWHLREST